MYKHIEPWIYRIGIEFDQFRVHFSHNVSLYIKQVFFTKKS